MVEVMLMKEIEDTTLLLGVDLSILDLDSIHLPPSETCRIVSDDEEVYEEDNLEFEFGFELLRSHLRFSSASSSLLLQSIFYSRKPFSYFYQDISKPTKAQECLSQMLQIDGRKAINDLSMGLSVDGPNVECLYLRASCYHALGQYKEAVKDYDVALDLELDSMDKFVLQCLAFCQVGAITFVGLTRLLVLEQLQVAALTTIDMQEQSSSAITHLRTLSKYKNSSFFFLTTRTGNNNTEIAKLLTITQQAPQLYRKIRFFKSVKLVSQEIFQNSPPLQFLVSWSV
ncbi:hypothetical protein VIGAN_08297100 [Vigna angularis var. angularis]|uniref:Uncharacterized protein n=1 Tax=Vigna angularis var. angularis TaxID=157739 RepID=A0A0S3STC1_PHAAN|nr:hypothetical protein VIGAN_08297100 [Vigna angularis var. angularis]